ncbi:hypothetical protein PBY51_023971 [Eleginops maclovinus]|uniref:Uncharacterized protein n=1 Tax=Eleginops maclovinus TaxID=56733 RepID=A0AAN7Y0E0_ELEMC|nr:hypothetical protein PBY51_023971 [Eleginops maclovinus]
MIREEEIGGLDCLLELPESSVFSVPLSLTLSIVLALSRPPVVFLWCGKCEDISSPQAPGVSQAVSDQRT